MDPFLRDLVPPTTEPVVEASEEVIEPTVEVTEQEQQTRSLAPRFEIKPLIFSKPELFSNPLTVSSFCSGDKFLRL